MHRSIHARERFPALSQTAMWHCACLWTGCPKNTCKILHDQSLKGLLSRSLLWFQPLNFHVWLASKLVLTNEFVQCGQWPLDQGSKIQLLIPIHFFVACDSDVLQCPLFRSKRVFLRCDGDVRYLEVSVCFLQTYIQGSLWIFSSKSSISWSQAIAIKRKFSVRSHSFQSGAKLRSEARSDFKYQCTMNWMDNIRRSRIVLFWSKCPKQISFESPFGRGQPEVSIASPCKH